MRNPPSLRLRFPVGRIAYWASRYPGDDASPVEAALRRIRRERSLRRADLLSVARWKTPRSRPRIARNSDRAVRAATREALTSRDERRRIESLTALHGVGFPTASAILHFCHADPYPVLDTRALWSLGVEKIPGYDFDFWWAYVGVCRDLARRARCAMRGVDRALWQYASEREPRRS
ncbi:MAG TPA: hypothetical protein VIA45_17775 [Thermoanaerobaculia bacterium]